MPTCTHTKNGICDDCVANRFRSAKYAIDNYVLMIKKLRAIEYMPIDSFVHNCLQLVAVGNYMENHGGHENNEEQYAARRMIVKNYISSKIREYIDEKL